MPPAVAAAGIAAAGSLGGALIGRSGNNRALQSQERATNAQIALERERDAARDTRYQGAMKSYEAEKVQYDQIRRQLLEHYGVNMPAQQQAPAPGMAHTMGGGMSLGQLMGAGAAGGGMPAPAPSGPTPPQAAGPEAPASEGDVFDWRRYGVS